MLVDVNEVTELLISVSTSPYFNQVNHCIKLRHCTSKSQHPLYSQTNQQTNILSLYMKIPC